MQGSTTKATAKVKVELTVTEETMLRRAETQAIVQGDSTVWDIVPALFPHVRQERHSAVSVVERPGNREVALSVAAFARE